MIKKYFFLALSNLKRRGLRSWLTMLGIFIGIAAVVSLITLGQGLQNAITGQFSSLGTDKLIMTNAQTAFGPPGSTAVRKLTDHDSEIIRQINNVEEVIPRLLRPIQMDYNKRIGYSFAVSMPQNEKQLKLIYETINLEAESGRVLRADDPGKILLGNDFSTTESFDKAITTGSTIKIQGKAFEVVGILKKASTFELNSVVLMNEKDMKDLLEIKDEWDLIVIKIASSNDIEEVAKEITEKIRKDRNEKEGEEDFSIQTPSQAVESVNTILNIINLIIAGIAAISLIVGGVGIANTMYTSVLERTKDIGVMKAIGAKNSDILWIFVFEAGLLGLVGGIIGAILGLTLAFSLSSIANAALGNQLLLIKVSPLLIIGSIAFSLIIGLISGVLPAIAGSKLKPVDALRS
jgi:putative ABC transport system permease protein